MVRQLLRHFLGIAAESLGHRFTHAFNEPVAARIPLGGQILNDAANLVKPFAHIWSVLARELDHLRCIPHNVVLADSLEPERLDAQRAAPDF